jgi:hypothetical protein
MISLSLARARLRRLLIVPVSTPQMTAASSYDAPLAPTNIKTSRCSLLISGDRNPLGEFAVTVLDLARAFAMVRIENVAENGAQPRAKICSGQKFLRISPCAEQGLLDEVVRKRRGSTKRNRDRPQTRNLSSQFVPKAAATHRWERALEQDFRGLEVVCLRTLARAQPVGCTAETIWLTCRRRRGWLGRLTGSLRFGGR